MGTERVTVRETRQNLRRLLDRVQAGDEVVVMRRGVEVGRLVRPERKSPPLPDLSGFRSSITVRGRSMSEEIKVDRRSERY